MATLADAAALCRADDGLAVVSTLRANGGIQSSVVNAAFTRHPLDDAEVVAFVTCGRVKLANLRERPRISVAVKSGWEWAAVEGDAEVVGPDDPDGRIDAERYRLLLREVFTAAGGVHDDWEAYDRVMAEQRRAVVFVRPSRVYGNR
ncbi:TIGR03618 family F420-dependent PPOX class oxidoreductase [Umezawaea sp. Da 62-37]|uniref:TIGR03618 family F420-dependent PPOX class oxidoreductase n=1 Tax=Umezawaea sp. Da 62-37 TaxID=3075927 RepID=UPI0028F6FD73|nr:TIGR03618 family F420-dependent PPOX class oxidoreductase [Umezawaea sp. Da 62-37]WNV86348.1 TIGR03618 family F420-dependent PPOX class oxidoreductase [Umezawaea sp. Da 62-37]